MEPIAVTYCRTYFLCRNISRHASDPWKQFNREHSKPIFTVIFFPSGLKYESNQTICAASDERAEIKRPLLNSFIITTVCWNHHTYISIILLLSTCLSPKVMKINWKKLPQQLPEFSEQYIYMLYHALNDISSLKSINKHMYILHIHCPVPFSTCYTIL